LQFGYEAEMPFGLTPAEWELAKLGAQFVGALIITWCAVKWALRRFQREKAWERRFNAYADALTAISDMRLLAGMELDDIESHRDISEELRADRAGRYRLAKRQLEQVVAVSGLLFPAHVTVRLADLSNEIAQSAKAECGLYQAIDNEYSILSATLRALRDEAQLALGLDSRWKRLKRWFASPFRRI
jgi:hypothetical protein